MIYYAHSLKKYHTQAEKQEMALLCRCFNETIYNPNTTEIQQAYNPMQVCLEKIQSAEITAVVFSLYKGHVGKGVYQEVELAQKLLKPVYVISDQGIEPFLQKLMCVQNGDWAVRYAKIIPIAPHPIIGFGTHYKKGLAGFQVKVKSWRQWEVIGQLFALTVNIQFDLK